MSDERRKVLHEWTLAGYHCRIVEVQPGIVSAEQAMDDDVRGRLWLPKLNPMGWQNEMIQLSSALATSEAAREKAEAERLTLAKHITRNPLSSVGPPPLVARALAARVSAQPGDWIIRGVKGEFYPCKPDIFEATHEPADVCHSVPPGERERRPCEDTCELSSLLRETEAQERRLAEALIDYHEALERAGSTCNPRCPLCLRKREVAEARAILAAPAPDPSQAGTCNECGGPVFHRHGFPGEFNHECWVPGKADR